MKRDVLFRYRHVDAKRRARDVLTVSAVADHDFFGIDVCFEPDVAAKASAVDLHLATPFTKGALPRCQDL